MGLPVLVLGESGSGKSASLRNFAKDEAVVFNVASKPLPFRGGLPTIKGAGYRRIAEELSKGECKRYVIDDSQYLMCFEMFQTAKEKGYEKFTDMALHFYNLLQFIIQKLPPDVIVYFLHHTEQNDNGKVKAKTIGKMIDEKLTLEGLFSVVLMCKTDGNRHFFETKSDGFTTVKTPIGMFEQNEIDNDLKTVDATIREYYNDFKEDF